jgi:hypothetical protein
MAQWLRRDRSVGDILKSLSSLSGIINLPHMNNAPSIVNIGCSEFSWMTTRRFGEVGTILRVNMTNSSTAKVSLSTDLSPRKTRVKKSNDMKGLSRSQLLHGGL